MSDNRVTALLNRLGGLYRDPNKVERDASHLLRSSVGKNLKPQIAALVENDGTTTNTLVLQGTIAFHYRGNTYQQLMDIYLPPGYAVRPPRCFVRLAENMYLKEKHPHVGPDGLVYLPYLTNWRPQTHTLVELVVNMSSVFSADPPVFRRSQPPPLPPTPPPSYGVYTTSVTTVQQSSNDNADAVAILQREAEEANAVAEAARRAEREEAERAKQRKAQEEWDKKNLASTKEKVRRKLYSHLQEESKETKTILEHDTMEQGRLETASELLNSRIKILQKQKKELDAQVKTVQEATKEIEEWLEEAKTNARSNEEKSVDELAVPVAPVYKQMMDLSVKSHCITDALYFLDRALQKRTINVSTHLKQVRTLAKKQFLAKAHLVKIQQAIQGNDLING